APRGDSAPVHTSAVDCHLRKALCVMRLSKRPPTRVSAMLRNPKLVAILAVLTAGLSACYAPPPRQTVVYRDDYPQQHYQGAYREAPPPPTEQSGVCHTCGTVRGFDQVALSQPNTGGGAVLGAIIGGLVGNQFGAGSGKAAATAAGVVGGAVVGNS